MTEPQKQELENAIREACPELMVECRECDGSGKDYHSAYRLSFRRLRSRFFGQEDNLRKNMGLYNKRW